MIVTYDPRHDVPDCFHDYPEDDLIEHEISGTDCVCGPDLEFYVCHNGCCVTTLMVMHHSLDGRELEDE